MMPNAADALLQQREVIARFGELAPRSDDLTEILTEACRLVGAAIGTDLAKVMELQADGKTMLVKAGIGWKPGIVGEKTLEAEPNASEEYALATGRLPGTQAAARGLSLWASTASTAA